MVGIIVGYWYLVRRGPELPAIAVRGRIRQFLTFKGDRHGPHETDADR